MDPPAECSDENYTEKPPVNYRYTNRHFPLDATFVDNKKCFNKNMTYYFQHRMNYLFWKLVL